MNIADFYLCENGVEEESGKFYHPKVVEAHTFVRLQGEKREELESIYYTPSNDTWSHDEDGSQPMTREEAQAILAKYPRIDQGMRPIQGLLG